MEYKNIFEIKMNEYTEQISKRIDSDFSGSREAMLSVAQDKVKEFMLISDSGLDKDTRKLLAIIILASMLQSFSFGYGIGKIEGETMEKICL